MPEALRPTQGGQVGWGRVNLVAIGSLRWSRYSLPSTSPASDGPCAQERRLTEIRIQMEATICSRQRALAADFQRNMLHSPEAMPKTIPELKSALQQIWDDLPQTTINKAISNFANVWTHVFRPVADILSIRCELCTEICLLNCVLVHKMSVISVLNLLFIVS